MKSTSRVARLKNYLSVDATTIINFIKESNFYHLVCIVLFCFHISYHSFLITFLYNLILVTVYNVSYIFS